MGQKGKNCQNMVFLFKLSTAMAIESSRKQSTAVEGEGEEEGAGREMCWRGGGEGWYAERMKAVWCMARGWVAAGMVAFGMAAGAMAADEEGPAPVDGESLAAQIGDAAAARELMAAVQGSVPNVPLSMDAEIMTLSPAGKRTGRIRAQALWMPGKSGRKAVYELLGDDGEPEARMTVGLPEAAGQETSFRYEWGRPPAETETPDLFAPIGGSDICWMELSFSFFWWANPRITGVEKVKGRWWCQVVELDCPLEFAREGGWDTLRLWVAPAYGAAVKGEALRGGTAVKSFEVESVTKVRKVYMISEMTVRNRESGGRSRLKLSHLELEAPEYTDEERALFEGPVRW